MSDYIKAYPLPNNTENFISAAVQLNEDAEPYHAGIIIKNNRDYKVLHFNTTGVHFDDITDDEWYFLKEFPMFNNKLTQSFYNYFVKILGDPRPTYGLFYHGALYDIDGHYYSDIGLPNYASCVGFCLNVIKGAMYEEEYIKYDDWNSEVNLEGREAYVEKFIERIKLAYPDIEEGLIRSSIRRILPIEYFAAAYFTKLPVTKDMIDKITPQLSKKLRQEVA